MSISNLSSQYISQSFQSLVQIDTVNGNIYDGLGAQINNVNIIASSAVTSSYIQKLTQNVIITGSLNVTGSQTFRGNKTISGSVFISGSKTIVGNNSVTGAMDISGTLSMTGPFVQNSAALTSPLISGSIEYDGSTFYRISDSSGRSLNANHHLFYLPTAITHSLTTIVDAFSGSLNIFTMLPNVLYEVQYNLFYQKGASAGTTTWTINSVDQTMQLVNAQNEITPVAGTNVFFNANATTTSGAPLTSTIINYINTQAVPFTIASQTLNTYHRATIKTLILSNASLPSKLKLQVTSAGSAVTMLPGSYYIIKKMPASSVGVFTV
jgi:hypothetical protein